MAVLGLKLIGMDHPLKPGEIKKLLVYVEMDRCTADAVAFATGARLGRRSLKFVDCGIMAATFMNLETNRAVRLVSTEESRDLTDEYAPAGLTGGQAAVEAYKRMPDRLMFRAEEVKVNLSEFDMPGPTRRKTTCQACGQVIRDGRERVRGGRTLCRHCAGEGYFQPLGAIPLGGGDA